jgi:hypothetical protein
MRQHVSFFRPIFGIITKGKRAFLLKPPLIIHDTCRQQRFQLRKDAIAQTVPGHECLVVVATINTRGGGECKSVHGHNQIEAVTSHLGQRMGGVPTPNNQSPELPATDIHVHVEQSSLDLLLVDIRLSAGARAKLFWGRRWSRDLAG